MNDAERIQELEDELRIALMFIRQTKEQIFNARMGDGDMHEAILQMIANSPNMIYNHTRILLTDKDKTFLKLSRKEP